MGVPEELALDLSRECGIHCFIETGTFHGGTTSWAASHFQTVHTIEYSREIFDKTAAKLEALSNVKFHFGDSRTVLLEKIPASLGPCLFWLDAHWCSGSTYGRDDQCPLLEELKLINEKYAGSFLLIDDARLFVAAPPTDHIENQWPTLFDIIDTLRLSNEARHIAIFEDVIIIVPMSAKFIVDRYCRSVLANDGARATADYLRAPHLRNPGCS